MPEVVSNVVDRYALGQAIAAGGMATLHLGRLVGSAGFARTVAIKRLHSHLCLDPNFVKAFADEARLAARIRHPNVVPTLDVVSTEPSVSKPGELLLVMEYIDGEALSALCRGAEQPIPLPIVVAIVSEMLHGLHSAHEAKSESGEPLGIVHRDVSPQNVLVGADGVARLVDFGIARATGRAGNTNDGEIKGKLAYMAPEQIRRDGVTRKTDIFAAGVVLWELLTGERLFASDNPGSTLEKILVGWVAPPSSITRDLPPAFDEITLRALDADPNNRFATARDMAVALEDACRRALGRDVGEWVEATAGEALAHRRQLVVDAERGTDGMAFEPTVLGQPPAPSPAVSRQPGVLTIEPEDTDTLFKDSPALPVASEPTITAFTAGSDPVSLATLAPPPPNRGTATSKAIAVVALAASLTVFFGTRYATTSARLLESPAAATTDEIMVPSPQPMPAPTAALTPLKAVLAPSVAPSVAATPVLPAPAALAAAPQPVRRAPKPRPAVIPSSPRTACVAKLDPATGKTIYKGDCD